MENYSKAVDSFPDPFGIGSQLSVILAIFAELLCGVLIAVGFATRFTVIPLIITMATAFFIIHGGDAFGDKEMSFIYLAMYLVIFIIGPGKYSVDKLISK
jgi:putative oxidoreductase